MSDVPTIEELQLGIESIERRDEIIARWEAVAGWARLVELGRFPSLHAGPDENADGEIRYWIMLVNPAVELPPADSLEEAVALALAHPQGDQDG